MTKSTELVAAYWTIAGDVYPFAPNEISPFPFAQRVEAAAKAGYKGVGLIHADLQATREQIGLEEMRRILDANGMPHVELEFITHWFSGGELKLASDKVRKELFEAAEALGARDVKIAPEFDAKTIDLAHVTDSFAEICQDAARYGTSIALEVMPFSNVGTLETACAIVEGAAQRNGGLLLDIWHIGRGGIPYEAVAKVPRQYVVSVELDDADADVVGTLWEDTIYQRRLCGEGVLDPPAFIDAIQRTGFDGFYSVEVISRKHRVLPLEEAARRSFETTMAQFAGT
ncbi:sugar phosphate isomerase/epimerase family protein [Mesorhizobium sp. B2-1-3A]|uniref:sugar phosphate isomerase/epimerase family protein n=1 Tax=Mesorhizobium sp. B2-1-3A TaxID=2589971 RepID=UPI00112EC82F|nr:sugar phosphate isomerase/epimerase family protein [Mesorhizobium sp. B2-1-3A]TPM94726.1 sugar phosphate isomerase/epimerase [Mesorhizobium sp. B2-1-3A]